MLSINKILPTIFAINVEFSQKGLYLFCKKKTLYIEIYFSIKQKLIYAKKTLQNTNLYQRHSLLAAFWCLAQIFLCSINQAVGGILNNNNAFELWREICTTWCYIKEVSKRRKQKYSDKIELTKDRDVLVKTFLKIFISSYSNQIITIIISFQ